MDRPKKDLNFDKLKTFKGNTEFWNSLWPKMDTDAFLRQASYYLANCFRTNTVTYEDAIVHVVMPEALARIQELEAEVASLKQKREK